MRKEDKDRRKRIYKGWILLDDAADTLRQVYAEESDELEILECMPEDLQNVKRVEQMRESVGLLSRVLTKLLEIKDDLDGVADG